jgi:hypothetical protein
MTPLFVNDRVFTAEVAEHAEFKRRLAIEAGAI